MDPVRFRNDMTVNLLDSMGGDHSLTRAARVSLRQEVETEILRKRNRGLIKYLMEHRHGSPFEHASMTFLIECPIFVVREFMRHRIGFSYNEMSGRYTELEPVFWLPKPERGMINLGTSARPEMGDTPPALHELVGTELRSIAQLSWNGYQSLLQAGAAREIARTLLPINIYTRFITSCNPRSLMSFLSLRVNHPDARYPTYPLPEIQEVAEKMEEHGRSLFPITLDEFARQGRVAP